MIFDRTVGKLHFSNLYFMLKKLFFVALLTMSSLSLWAEGEDKSITAYPNPAVDQVVFHLGELAAKGGTITIYNTIGAVIAQIPVGPSTDFVFNIPSSWAPSLYIVTFEDTDGAMTQPIKLTIRSSI